MNTTSDDFILSRDALKSKQKHLKKEGKGNKPNKAECLTDNEINLFYEKGLLGDDSAESMLNTLWLNNSIHFGFRGSDEHYKLKWGDIVKKQTSDGTKFLQFNERLTKTRTGDNNETRKTNPKMFENKNNPSRCPITIYEKYCNLRPEGYNNEDDPFYLATRTIGHSDTKENDIWFKKQKVGDRKLAAMMKTMAVKAGIPAKKLTNHSCRKHLVQKLRDNNIETCDIMAISGHKSEKSILNYSELSEQKHQEISNILQNASAPQIQLNSKPAQPKKAVSTFPNPDSELNNTPVGVLPSNAQTNTNPAKGAVIPQEPNLHSMFYGATLNIQNLHLFMQPPLQTHDEN